MLCLSSYTIKSAFTFQRPSNSNNNELLLLLFWWPLEGKKVKYMLCLNALAKLQNVRGASRRPALMGNCPSCNHMSWSYQSTKWFVVSPFQVVCGAWCSVATREVPLEEKVDTKCMYAGNLTQKYSKDDKETKCSYHVTYSF